MNPVSNTSPDLTREMPFANALKATARPPEITSEMEELADQIGEFVYYWGFKRIHGKIWTHLHLAQSPLDAADLVRRLSISKALVSISLRELLEFEVIEACGKSARGTQLYKVNGDIMSVILSVLRQREKRMLSRVEAAHRSLQRVMPTDQERMQISASHLDQLGDLIEKASMALDSFIALKPIDFTDWDQAFRVATDEQETDTQSRERLTLPV